jgi:hypothetical protein
MEYDQTSMLKWTHKDQTVPTDWGALKLVCWLAGAMTATGSSFGALCIVMSTEDFLNDSVTLVVAPNWKGMPMWN